MACMWHSCLEAIGSLTVPKLVLELRNREEMQVTLEDLWVYWKPVETLLVCCGRYCIGEGVGCCILKSLLLTDHQVQVSQGRTRWKTRQNPGTSSVSYALLFPRPSPDIEDGCSLESLELVLAGQSLLLKGKMILQLIPEVQRHHIFQWCSLAKL